MAGAASKCFDFVKVCPLPDETDVVGNDAEDGSEGGSATNNSQRNVLVLILFILFTGEITAGPTNVTETRLWVGRVS